MLSLPNVNMRKRCLVEPANNSKGILYIAAVPIGNRDDISQRVLVKAENVDYILAEDTRSAGLLFSSFDIKQKYVSYHDFSDDKRRQKVLTDLEQGLDIMLVTDAGTPAISDPGYKIVADARQAGLLVIPLPGACAAISALSVGGLPTDRFIFAGFLKKGEKRKKELSQLLELPYTIVIYESAQRVIATLKDIMSISGNRRCFIAREMTKKYEEYFWSTAEDLIAELSLRKVVKGELVLLIEGKPLAEVDTENIKKIYRSLRDKGLSFKDSLELISEIKAVSKGKIRQIIADYVKM